MPQNNSNKPEKSLGNTDEFSWNDSFHSIDDLETFTSGKDTPRLEADWDTSGGPIVDQLTSDHAFRKRLDNDRETFKALNKNFPQ